jgi:hypothetical protein
MTDHQPQPEQPPSARTADDAGGARPVPDVRVSDAERNQVVDDLRRFCADGYLTLDEFSDRIADQAAGGEVLASTLVRDLTASSGEFEFGEERVVELKGLAGSHTMVTVRS